MECVAWLFRHASDTFLPHFILTLGVQDGVIYAAGPPLDRVGPLLFLFVSPRAWPLRLASLSSHEAHSRGTLSRWESRQRLGGVDKKHKGKRQTHGSLANKAREKYLQIVYIYIWEYFRDGAKRTARRPSPGGCNARPAPGSGRAGPALCPAGRYIRGQRACGAAPPGLHDGTRTKKSVRILGSNSTSEPESSSDLCLHSFSCWLQSRSSAQSPTT